MIWNCDTEAICSTPKDIAEHCTASWQKVFNSSQSDPDATAVFKRNFSRKLPLRPPSYWTPTVLQVKEAILAAHHSAAGPDGVPFEAFKATADIAAPILHRVILVLLGDDPLQLPDWFNEAFLVLLPKKPYETGKPGIGEVYRPEDLRPLSIVNTFNRLIANISGGFLNLSQLS